MSASPLSPSLLGLADPAKQRLNSKLQILRLLENYRAAHDYSLRVADVLFSRAWNSGELAVDRELTEAWPQLSDRTLEGWRQRLKNNGVGSLAGQYGNRKGKTTIAIEVQEHIIGMLVQFPHVRSTRVMEFLQGRFRDRADVKLPSPRTLSRWIADWKNKNAQTFTAVTNPDKWKNKFMAAFGDADGNVDRLNQIFQLDGTRADIELVEGRYSLSVGIDVYSRRVCLLVAPSTSTSVNAQLLRKMIIAWGVPEAVKTDQGKDYVSFAMQTVLRNLDIQHLVSNKFSPWEKPFVERCIQTLLHDLAELLPGYVGHNVTDAQTLRASRSFAERLFQKNGVQVCPLTAQQFQQFCDDWCESRYQHREHSELKKSPFQMATEYRGQIRRIQDERALDMLLAEVPSLKGMRVVQKKGIQLPEGYFVAAELEAHIGKQVHIRYLQDAGRIVVYDPTTDDGWTFICVAVLPELTGISRQEIAAKTRHMQRERVQSERAALRAIAKRVSARDAAYEILRDNMRSNGKLLEFPKRSEAHETAALSAAREAITELDRPLRSSSELIDRETFQQALAAEDKPKVLQPQFESRTERLYWIANQSYQRMLSGEEMEELERFRRECPRDAAEMDEMMLMRHGDLADMDPEERAQAERYRNQFPRLAKPA